MILRHGNVENCRLCRWKTHSQPMEKDEPFPQVCKQVSHSNAGSGCLHIFPQRLLLRIPVLSFPIRHKKKEKRKQKSGSTAIGRTEKLYSRDLLAFFCCCDHFINFRIQIRGISFNYTCSRRTTFLLIKQNGGITCGK